MDNSDQINSLDNVDVLPHLKSSKLIDDLYPRMVAPDDLGDNDVVSTAELWVVE